MSYILDALKKGKSKEEQSDVPDLSSEHAYHEFEEERSLAQWIWPMVVMLLVLIIGVLGFMLLNPSAKEVSQQWTQTVGNGVEKSRATGATPEEDTASIAFDKSSQEPSRLPSEPQILNKPLQVSEPVVQKVRRQTPATKTTNNQNMSSSTTPKSKATLSKSDLPSLIYTTHIYATKAKDRFVMINGKALAEGDTISNQLTIKEILENDLVVIYKGQEFVLPSLEDVNVD